MSDMIRYLGAEIRAGWNAGNNAGNGFEFEDEGDLVLVGTVDEGDRALDVYEGNGRLVAVGHVGGPWAVDVTAARKGRRPGE